MSSPSPNDLTRQQLDELDALLQRMLSLPLSPPGAAAAPPPPPQALPPIPYAPRTPAPVPSVSLPAGWRVDPPAAPKPTLRPPVVEEELPEVAAAVAPLTAVPMAAPPTQGYKVDPVNLAAELPLPPSAPARLFGPPSDDTGVPPSAPVGTLRGVDAPALPLGYRPPTAPAPLPPAQPAAEEAFAELTPAPAADEPPAPEQVRATPRVPLPLWPLFATNWVLETAVGLLGPVGTLLTRGPMKHALGWTGLALLAGAGAWAARGMGWVQW